MIILYLLASLFFIGGAWLLRRTIIGPPKRSQGIQSAGSEQLAGRAFLAVFAALAILIGVAILSVGMRDNLTPAAKRAQRLMSYYDRNQNKHIDLPSECSRKMRSGKITPCHAELFAQADADSSQSISVQELEAHLIKYYDRNGDSLISKEEDMGIAYREGAY